MKKTTHKSRDVMKGILTYLDEIGEQKILPEVTKSLKEVVDRTKKTDEIIVASVIPFTSLQLKTLKSVLIKALGIELPIKNNIDKNLVGGFTVRVNDWFLDASITHQLEVLKRTLTS